MFDTIYDIPLVLNTCLSYDCSCVVIGILVTQFFISGCLLSKVRVNFWANLSHASLLKAVFFDSVYFDN